MTTELTAITIASALSLQGCVEKPEGLNYVLRAYMDNATDIDAETTALSRAKTWVDTCAHTIERERCRSPGTHNILCINPSH